MSGLSREGTLVGRSGGVCWMSWKTWSHADGDLDGIEPLFSMFVPESDALVEYSRLESKLRRDNVNEGEDLSLRVAEKRECTGTLGG